MKKKVKRYQGGGLADIAENAQSLMSEVDNMANTINYGSGASGPSSPVGMSAFEGMKKGGKVKKMAAGGSASKRADGCAQRGKTRGKMV